MKKYLIIIVGILIAFIISDCTSFKLKYNTFNDSRYNNFVVQFFDKFDYKSGYLIKTENE